MPRCGVLLWHARPEIHGAKKNDVGGATPSEVKAKRRSDDGGKILADNTWSFRSGCSRSFRPPLLCLKALVSRSNFAPADWKGSFQRLKAIVRTQTSVLAQTSVAGVRIS